MQNNGLLRKISPLLICLLGLIIYSNTFHVPFVFDDTWNIAENPAIRNLGNIKTIWNFCATRFVTFFSLALNYHFHKLALPGYHIFNLAVHLGSAILVYWFILLTFSTPYFTPHSVIPACFKQESGFPLTTRGNDMRLTEYLRNLIALFGALLFVCHPVQTQAVTYVIQRAASFATFWYLLTLCLYAKARLSSDSRPYYVGSIISAALALFTKETAITLPFILIFWELCFFPEPNGKTVRRILPFFIPFLAALVSIKLTGSVDFEGLRRTDQRFYGANTISSHNYLLTQFRVIVTYIRLLLIPINQNLDYDYPIAKNLFNLPVFTSLILLLIILVTGFILFRRYRLLSFGIFWFFLTLIPESSIIPIQDVIFEHRLYLPMVGYALFLPSALYYLFSRIKLPRPLSAVPCMLSTVYCLLLITLGYSTLTYLRNRVWQNDLSLWNDTVKKSPHKARPRNSRGVAYRSRGEYEKAISDYTRTLQFNPYYAEAYNNRGNAYTITGRYDQALSDYNMAIQIAPQFTKPYYNRGVLYFKKGDLNKSIADYTRAIELNPIFAEIYNRRGLAYYAKQEYGKSISDFWNAFALDPDYLEPYYNLSKIYQKQNQPDELTLVYQKLLEHKSDPTIHNELGILYGKKSLWDKALAEFKSAIKLKPDNAKFYNNLGIAYIKKGDQISAIQAWTRALRLDPQLKETRENLSKILKKP